MGCGDRTLRTAGVTLAPRVLRAAAREAQQQQQQQQQQQLRQGPHMATSFGFPSAASDQYGEGQLGEEQQQQQQQQGCDSGTDGGSIAGSARESASDAVAATNDEGQAPTEAGAGVGPEMMAEARQLQSGQTKAGGGAGKGASSASHVPWPSTLLWREVRDQVVCCAWHPTDKRKWRAGHAFSWSTTDVRLPLLRAACCPASNSRHTSYTPSALRLGLPCMPPRLPFLYSTGYVAFGCSDGSVGVMDLRQQMGRVYGVRHSGPVTALAWVTPAPGAGTPVGRGSQDGRPRDGKQQHELQQPQHTQQDKQEQLGPASDMEGAGAPRHVSAEQLASSMSLEGHARAGDVAGNGAAPPPPPPPPPPPLVPPPAPPPPPPPLAPRENLAADASAAPAPSALPAGDHAVDRQVPGAPPGRSPAAGMEAPGRRHAHRDIDMERVLAARRVGRGHGHVPEVVAKGPTPGGGFAGRGRPGAPPASAAGVAGAPGSGPAAPGSKAAAEETGVDKERVAAPGAPGVEAVGSAGPQADAVTHQPGEGQAGQHAVPGTKQQQQQQQGKGGGGKGKGKAAAGVKGGQGAAGAGGGAAGPSPSWGSQGEPCLVSCGGEGRLLLWPGPCSDGPGGELAMGAVPTAPCRAVPVDVSGACGLG